jgi:ABC-type polysaccharide/polyol phosphate export permease
MTIGLSLVLSAINVHLRDVEQILTNLLNLFFFLTPILYPISTIPERYRGIILLNPMALLMISYQDILFNGKAPDWRYLLILIIISILIFIYGYIIFDRFKDSLIEEV